MKKNATTQEIARYRKYYPELTRKQVYKVLNEVKNDFGRLDAVTVHYFMEANYPKILKVT